MNMNISIVVGSLLFASTLAVAAGQRSQGASTIAGGNKKAAEEIARLIAELASDSYRKRTAATRKLMEMDEALPALREAFKKANLETQRRTEKIIAAIEDRTAEQFIRAAVGKVNEEGLDLFVDRMVLQKQFATDARWKELLGLAKALSVRASKLGIKASATAEVDFAKYPVCLTWDQNHTDRRRLLIDGVDQQVISVHNCLLVSSGSFRQFNSTDRSILFVNGDIEGMNSTTNSIIFCNGTIKSMNYTADCLIFCRGVIKSMNCTERNAIFVTEELQGLNCTKNNIIEATKLGNGNLSEGNVYVNRMPRDRDRSDSDRFVKLEPSPLQLFSYFDSAKVGLRCTMVNGDARVDKMLTGKPFEKSGLRTGDLILAIDRVKFTTEAAFRALLRRKMVSETMVLKIQRDDRVLEVPVRLAQ